MDKIIQILPLVGISCILIALFCEVILRTKPLYNKRRKSTGAYTLEGSDEYDSIEYWKRARNKTLFVSVASFIITGILVFVNSLF
jgi:hypothetical protein